MMTVTWIKVINDRLGKVELGIVDRISRLGEKVKVSVAGNKILVKGVGRYDEEKIKVLEKEGFSSIEDFEFEHW